MKKILFALAMGFALTGCVTPYDTYDGYGYNDYNYGYTTEYIIINNGYRYVYDANVIDAITNRMVLEMALDRARAARLLELNRRYFYIFHSMPNYSFGYYSFNPGPPPPPRGPVGPGYYGGSNRPPYGGGYGNGYGNYYGRGQGGYRSNYDVDLTERDLQAAAKEYTRAVKSIVGNQNYNVFETRVRSDAKIANQKVNAVRVNPNANAVRSNTTSTNTNTNTGTATRTRTGTNSNIRTNAGTAVRSNSNATGGNTQQNTGTTTTRTRVRSNNNTTTTSPQQGTSTTRSRVRSNSTTTTPQQSGTTNTRVRSNSSSSSSNSGTTTTATPTRSRTRTR
ncbi:MAG: hypothetical protein IKP48_04520 [Bacteroidaceae bacterium]|nr:hypothetical protein [Bacteroidaceae bacterium]